MAEPSNLHSAAVGWAKIILPLCALGLLSTLFLFARGTNEPDELALAAVEAIARDQRVNAPEFSGLTDEGAAVVISAKSAQPDPSDDQTVNFAEMQMRMDNPDGSYLEVSSTRGAFDQRAEIAEFLGLARAQTSSGYQMETVGLIAELDTGVVTSTGVLEVRGPLGELTAGKLTYWVANDTQKTRVLFTEGVRLLYTPHTP